jgi:hypothetical protein
MWKMSHQFLRYPPKLIQLKIFGTLLSVLQDVPFLSRRCSKSEAILRVVYVILPSVVPLHTALGAHSS